MNGEYDFKDLFEAYLQQSERDVSWLARQLGKAPSTVSRWYHCETRPQNPGVLVQIAELLDVPDGERATFFTTAATYYGWSLSVFALALPANQAARTGEGVPLAPPIEVPDTHTPQPEPSPETEAEVEVKGWWWNQTERFFRRAANGNGAQSWEELLVYGWQQTKARLSSSVVSGVVLAVTLWYITFMMTTPALLWAITSSEERQFAFLLLAAAFVLVPVVVAGTVPAEQEQTIGNSNVSVRLQVWVLKYTSAGVGFIVGGIVMFAPVLLWHYGTEAATPTLLRVVIVTIPLLLSYLSVRRAPVHWLKIAGDQWEGYAGDLWFRGVVILAGPCFATCLYYSHDLLSHRLYGPTMILTTLLLITFINSKQSRAKTTTSA